MVKILSEKRMRESQNQYGLGAAMLSDRARFIYSAAFRRLQMKAQVFSLESNAAVRSRLSHSTEVAHIGIFLVTKIHELIKNSNTANENLKYIIDNVIPILHTVETACLIHDVGNPPFGHFGESAIRKWFNDNLEYYKDKYKLSIDNFVEISNYNDFLFFDGNPQGLRIISRLQGYDGNGLNLTLSLLASTMKYVSANDEVNYEDPLRKKLGYFSTERDIVSKIKLELGLDDGARHPLVYLMEAADDISYCISDIEDAIEKNICTYKDFFNFFNDEINQQDNLIIKTTSLDDKYLKSAIDKLNEAISAQALSAFQYAEIFMLFKTSITNFCVNSVSMDYIKKIDTYVAGKCNSIINKGTLVHKIQKIFKSYTKRFVFCSDEAELIELSGYSVIYGLLDKFKLLLDMSFDNFNLFVEGQYDKLKGENLDVEKRLFHRLPKKYINAYKLSIKNIPNKNDEQFVIKEFNLRAHLLVDYVSGMTDSFALEVFQALNGIKVKYDGC